MSLRNAMRKHIPPPVRRLLRLPRDADERHRAIAPVCGRIRARAWKRQRRAIHRRTPGRRTIVIALTEHIGDIVACEPIARHVRDANPGAFITWAVREPYRELIDTNPHIDAALPVGCLTQWLRLRDASLFDQAIDLHVEGRSCPRCRLHYTRADGSSQINIENYYHHGNLLRIACSVAGLPVLDETPRVYIPDRTRQRVDTLDLPDRFAVIHGSSNQPSRDWQRPKWQALVQRLAAELDLPVVEVGLDAVAGASPQPYRNLCGRLSLLQTAEVIRRAAVFIGIDSGPAHIANAAGTPGVILLGKYNQYDHYLPYSGDYGHSRNAHIFHAPEPAATIPVDDVYDAVRKTLAPAPSPSRKTAAARVNTRPTTADPRTAAPTPSPQTAAARMNTRTP